jgi:spermidine synthase
VVPQYDAYTFDMLNLIKEKEGKFDIIIDDGPHTWASQEWFFIYYYSLLNDGGVLVCEDIFEGYQEVLAKLKQDYGLYVLDLRMNNNPNRDEIIALRFK